MITLLFGSPGCGKTTHAVYTACKADRPVYHNIPGCTVGTYLPHIECLGRFTVPRGSLILIDEAGIEFNNRDYKSFPKALISYLKLHRHYGVDIYFYSQSWEDTDITIRRLADRLFYIRSFGRLPVSSVRRIEAFVEINENDHQIQFGYKKLKVISRFLPPPFNRPSFKLLFRWRYYRFFDTYHCTPLPLFPQIDSAHSKSNEVSCQPGGMPTNG